MPVITAFLARFTCFACVRLPCVRFIQSRLFVHETRFPFDESASLQPVQAVAYAACRGLRLPLARCARRAEALRRFGSVAAAPARQQPCRGANLRFKAVLIREVWLCSWRRDSARDGKNFLDSFARCDANDERRTSQMLAISLSPSVHVVRRF
eukprot:6203530-Pleurochrysis_carterae.AAC.1